MCDQKGCSMFWGFVYLFTGLALGGLAAWMTLCDMVFNVRVMEDPDLESDTGLWFWVVIGILALGAYCLIAGIIGMAGAGCEHIGTLIAFTVLASIGTIATISFAGLATADFTMATMEGLYEDREFNKVAGVFKNNLLNHYTNENATDSFTVAWNLHQTKYQCCGLDDYTDYQNATLDSSSYLVPWSCCVTDDDDNVLNIAMCRAEAEVVPADNFTYLNPEGCEESIIHRYSTDLIIMMATSLGAVILQIIALIVIGCQRSDTKHGTWTPPSE